MYVKNSPTTITTATATIYPVSNPEFWTADSESTNNESTDNESTASESVSNESVFISLPLFVFIYLYELKLLG